MTIQIPATHYLELLVGIKGVRVLSKEEREVCNQIFKDGETRVLGYVFSETLMSSGWGSLWTQSDWNSSIEVHQRQKDYSEKSRLESLWKDAIEREVIAKLKTCKIFMALGESALVNLAKDIVVNRKPGLTICDDVLDFQEIYDKKRE